MPSSTKFDYIIVFIIILVLSVLSDSYYLKKKLVRVALFLPYIM